MKNKNIYTVDYFINYYESIPESEWCIRAFYKKKLFGSTAHCAQGFCIPREVADKITRSGSCDIEDVIGCPKWYSLLNLFSQDTQHAINTVANTNNGDNPRYQQPTPKQRILAALMDIKKLQDKSTPSEPKEEPVYRFVEKHESVETLLEKEIIYS